MKIVKDKKIWNDLSRAAWLVRDNAFIYGNTKVGAALLSIKGNIYSGCNVEHKFRSHDIHAEVNAISTMIGFGESNFTHILIVAERDLFTPCGSCMDWIMQFGGENCMVGFQNSNSVDVVVVQAKLLMPYYPK